jgi:dTDP-4-dehydrorhamnose 3,5-epimerase
MIFRETRLKGSFVIEPEKHEDDRGFFARAWCQKEFKVHRLSPDMVQANIAFSLQKGTLRGMHYQTDPYQEAKLVRCIRGKVFDVIIDLRPDSNTYCEWLGVELTEWNHRMLYVPEDFAHGYQTLENNSEVFYLVSQFYSPGAERGVRWNDPAFGIDWPETENIIVSKKDRDWPDYIP